MYCVCVQGVSGVLIFLNEVGLTLGQCEATVHYKFTYPVYEIALFTGTRSS